MHYTRNMAMMGEEAVKEYRNLERNDTGTAAGNLKSGYAYANICV
jgi:hypothetical protein